MKKKNLLINWPKLFLKIYKVKGSAMEVLQLQKGYCTSTGKSTKSESEEEAEAGEFLEQDYD